ncbi:UNVERIFIED_CONTAM: hypothetical protein FKN15_036199 [Acipenser sinensis]
MEALEANTQVADWVYQEREAEQSKLAWAGVPQCSVCLCYGHEKESCPEAIWNPDTDLEWVEPERPTPKWEEPKRPVPRSGEPERPVPRRGEHCTYFIHFTLDFRLVCN